MPPYNKALAALKKKARLSEMIRIVMGYGASGGNIIIILKDSLCIKCLM